MRRVKKEEGARAKEEANPVLDAFKVRLSGRDVPLDRANELLPRRAFEHEWVLLLPFAQARTEDR
jgi:hypothetical protein